MSLVSAFSRDESLSTAELQVQEATLVLVGHPWPDGDGNDMTATLAVVSRRLEHVRSIAKARDAEVHVLAGGHILVVFPEPDGSTQVRATTCMAIQVALEMRLLSGSVDLPDRSKIAVCTGPTCRAMLGNQPRGTPAILGDAIDRALCMHALATPGQVLCDSTTWLAAQFRLGPNVRVRPLGTRSAGPGTIYEITTDSAAVSRDYECGVEPEVHANADAAIVVRRRGDIWTMDGGGYCLHLTDSKGMYYLASLLIRPDVEVLALELAGALNGHGVACDAAPEFGTTDYTHLSVSGYEGDAGAILDSRAKAAYRERLRDLEIQIDDAHRAGDVERASRADAEKCMLIRELRSAIGLGGRDRRVGSTVERARINVTRALRAAISRIASQCPPLGHHLEMSIRTGTFCSYRPSPGWGEKWRFE